MTKINDMEGKVVSLAEYAIVLVIINEVDRPCPRLVAQETGPGIYKYLHPDLADWREMKRDEGVTTLDKFGFQWAVVGNEIHCRKVKPSVATYKDTGEIREWQGEDYFTLPYEKRIVKLVGEEVEDGSK